MSSDTYIKEALIRHQVYLSRYAGSVVKELFEELALIRKELAALLKSYEDVDISRAGELRRLLNQVDAIIAETPLLAAPVASLSALEVAYMERLLITATKVTAETIKRTAPELVLAAVTKEPMKLYSTTGAVKELNIDGLVKEFTSAQRAEVKRAIRKGVRDGDSIDTISREVSRIVQTQSRRQANAMVRTAVNHVGHTARRAAVAANAEIIAGEVFVATLDSNTTLICIKYDTLGEVYLIGEGPIPPLHYRCRSIRSVKIKPEYAIPGLVGERPAVGMDREGNKVITTMRGDTRYAGFLRTQPKEFQDFALGVERAKLWRAGKVKVEDFTDDNNRTIPLDKLTDKDGNPVI